MGDYSLLIDPPLAAAPVRRVPLEERKLSSPPPRIVAPLLKPSPSHDHHSSAAAPSAVPSHGLLGGDIGAGAATAPQPPPPHTHTQAADIAHLPWHLDRPPPPNAVEEMWERNFAAVEAYAAAHGGDPNCAKSYVCTAAVSEAVGGGASGGAGSGTALRLGAWLHRQRQAHKRGSLAASRVARLAAAGVFWTPEEAFWERKFNVLEAYAAANGGDPNCPQNYVTAPPERLRLGAWLSHLRQSRKKRTLAQSRVRRLTDLGLRWNPEDAVWQRNYRALQEYAAAHGGDASGCPRTHVADGTGLRVGTWLHHQRSAQTGGVARTAERMRQLAKLGIEWAKGAAEEAAEAEADAATTMAPAQATTVETARQQLAGGGSLLQPRGTKRAAEAVAVEEAVVEEGGWSGRGGRGDNEEVEEEPEPASSASASAPPGGASKKRKKEATCLNSVH
jgi:hypothetical protein